jgi:hypothetical protein
MLLFDIIVLQRRILQIIGSALYDDWLFVLLFPEVSFTLVKDVLEQYSLLYACSRSAD